MAKKSESAPASIAAPVDRADDRARIANITSDDPRSILIHAALAAGGGIHGREQGSPEGPIPDVPGISFSKSEFEAYHGKPHTAFMNPVIGDEEPAAKPAKAKAAPKKKDEPVVNRTQKGPFAGWSRQDHIDYRTKNREARAAAGPVKPQPRKKKSTPTEYKPSDTDFDNLMGNV